MITLWPLLLPFAASSGWYFARRNRNKDSKDGNTLSREYFVGLNYLLNEQPDKAVDVFIKLLEVDNETVETHLALGSLFRRRGEVDRAIRIHQNLIARPQLAEHQRVEALMALGNDYMSAGVFDRAERIFHEIAAHGDNYEVTGLKNLIAIYQQEKSWLQVINIAQRYERASGERMNKVIAHYYCELADLALANNQYETVRRYIKKSLLIDPNSVRSSLLLGEIEIRQNRHRHAIKAFKKVKEQSPDFLSEIIQPLVRCYQAINDEKGCIKYLNELLVTHPRVSIFFVLTEHIRKIKGSEEALDFAAEQLGRHPSVKGLNQLIAWHIEATYGKVKSKLQILYDITKSLLENRPVYRCHQCGFSGKSLHWLCPSCKQWGTIKPIHGLEGD